MHRAVDRVRNKGQVKDTKTSTARRVPIHEELLPLLGAMHKAAEGKGKLFPSMPAPSALARRLRRFLKLAGVDRKDLHTTDATQTINRVLSFYPPHQQAEVRFSLSSALQAVVSLRLVPRQDKPGRVPALLTTLGPARRMTRQVRLRHRTET